MAHPSTTRSRAVSQLRAKAALYDELVERLAQAEDELERRTAELRAVRRNATRHGIDPAWREIANDLATALRPYTLFGEQVVENGRVVVHTRVPGTTLGAARRALDRVAEQVAQESHRAHTTPARDVGAVGGEEAA